MKIPNQLNILITAVSIIAIMGIAIIPHVSATESENTPITGVNPTSVPPGGNVDLILKGNPSSGKDPHDILLLRVHEPGAIANKANSIVPGTAPFAQVCDATKLISYPLAGDPQTWELRVKVGDLGTHDGEPFQALDLEGLEELKVKFGTGGVVTPVVTLNGGDGVTLSGTQLEWVNIHPTPSGVDNLNMIGEWSWETCGKEKVGLANPTNFNFDEGISVVQPVGGEIISINTAALLLAGLTTSGMWIVPSLVTVIGIGLTVYKIRKNN